MTVSPTARNWAKDMIALSSTLRQDEAKPEL